MSTPRSGVRSLPKPRRQRLQGAVGTKGFVAEVATFAVLCALASLHAWTRIEGTLAGYDLSRAQVEHADLVREQKALRIELATRKGARRVEADARAKLGMAEPTPDRIFVIDAPAPSADASRAP